MAQPKPYSPQLLLLAAFSRHDEALAWAKQKAQNAWGSIALDSGPFPFDDTDYYAREMGTNLRKVFLAFERLIDPGELAPIKLLTNAWEREYADSSGAGGPASSAEPRPLNLDPGYLGLGKLVLASTKDHAHRIYLGQGIFAEVTLHYVRGLGWQPLPWTFPDYRRPPALDFFTRCREYLYGLHQAQLRRESDSG